MKCRIIAVVLLVSVVLPSTTAAKEKKQARPGAPIGWIDLQAGSRRFSVSEQEFVKVTRNLPRGTLLPVFKTKEKHGVQIAQVSSLNLNTGNSELGWVEINSGELKPPQSFPVDSDLLQLLGAPYLDDFTAEHTAVARFLVPQAKTPPALLCYVVTLPLETAKLALFTSREGKFVLGATLNIPISDMKAGITSFEVRDLLGNGSECVITKEPFREGAQTTGTNLLIRQIASGQFQVLWQAPLEFKDLSEFPAKMQVLQPPEQNIGTPGTVTTGDVTFRTSGKGQEPVWKGKVEFFVFGREKAAQTVNIEKACPWEGGRFAPLR
jgi:hypothetical protein